MWGRDSERDQLDRALMDASVGHSVALLILGEPGVGKSTLLDHAAGRASDQGFEVLRTAGIEGEAQLGFSALAQLLRPLLPRIDQIPLPQSAALKSAFALDNQVAMDRFAAYSGALSLIALAAEKNPLLVAVDDVQWLDAESAEAVLFIARRLEAEPVALILAGREEEVDADARWLSLAQMHVAGLDRETSLALLAQGERRPAPGVAEELVASVRGNPLALLEIPQILSDDQLAGRAVIDEPLPSGPNLRRAFRGRLAGISPALRSCLLVAAASETGSLGEILPALKALDLDVKLLDAAETANLIAIQDGSVRFRHPILRSVVYQDASPADRRGAHTALAESLAEAGMAEGRAWHLAAAAIRPDEQVAAALEASAAAAHRRGAFGAAARSLARAAELSESRLARWQRLVGAGEAFLSFGNGPRAISLLEEALLTSDDPDQRAEVHLLLGMIRLLCGDPERTRSTLFEAANATAPHDPGRAAQMMMVGAFTHFMAAEIAPGLAVLRSAVDIAAEAEPSIRDAAHLALAIGLTLSGDREGATALLERHHRGLFVDRELNSLDMILQPFVTTLFLSEEQYGTVVELTSRLISSARATSAMAAIPYALAARADTYFRTGRWAAAHADAFESVRLAEDTGQVTQLAYNLVVLARVEAGLGQDAGCMEHTAQALGIASDRGLGSIPAFAHAARGLLHLGWGRYEEAIAELEAVRLLTEKHGLENPAIIQWAPDLVEAYWRAGRAADAAEVLAMLERQAARVGQPWAFAAVARGKGLLASDDSFDEHFREALSYHERTTTPFEWARTVLGYGQRLRRARKRRQGREHLRAALTTLEWLGASPWAEQARIELRASGGARPENADTPLALLTPQELQVALVVADGATNQEAAAALFLSPRTIDFHLRNVYRKLGLRSRSDLARIVAEREHFAPQPSTGGASHLQSAGALLDDPAAAAG